MVGRYFVTLDEDGRIERQGAILDMVSDAGYYEITTFSWIHGEARGSMIVSFDEIQKHFIFTGSSSGEHDAFCIAAGESVVGHLPPWGRKTAVASAK